MKRNLYLSLSLLCLSLAGYGQGSQINGSTQVYSGGYYGVYGTLTFNAGYFVTARASPSTNSVFFTANSGWMGASDGTHVNGYAQKVGNTAFTFPVGSGSDLRTLAISAPSAVSDNYEVAWIVGDPSTTVDPSDVSTPNHPTTSVGSGIGAVSTIGQWDWIPVVGTGAGLTVTASIPNGLTGLSASDLRLVGWNGSQWINLSGSSGASGNTEGSTLSGAMISGITAIGIGITSTAMPVDLVSFQGHWTKEKGNELIWVTSWEKNNDYFDVQSSIDAKAFESTGRVAGAGTITSQQLYTYVDTQPLTDLTYYRLKQVDTDGSFVYSKIIVIRKGELDKSLVIYPNPTTDQLFLKVVDQSITETNLFDQKGQRVLHQVDGSSQLQLNSLQAGVYTVEVKTAAGVVYQQRLIKH